MAAQYPNSPTSPGFGRSWLVIDEDDEDMGPDMEQDSRVFASPDKDQVSADLPVVEPLYDGDASSPPDYDLTPEDPNNFSFSFSEDDLLPYRPSWESSQYTSRPESPELGLADDRKLYSKMEETEQQSRITIQRAFILSEPTALLHYPQAPIVIDEPLREEKKARRISRTFSGLRLKSRSTPPGVLSLTQAPMPSPTPKDHDTASSSSSSWVQRSTSRGRKSRVKAEESPILPFFSRSKSQDARMRKRQSLRQALDTPPLPQPSSSPQTSHRVDSDSSETTTATTAAASDAVSVLPSTPLRTREHPQTSVGDSGVLEESEVVRPPAEGQPMREQVQVDGLSETQYRQTAETAETVEREGPLTGKEPHVDGPEDGQQSQEAPDLAQSDLQDQNRKKDTVSMLRRSFAPPTRTLSKSRDDLATLFRSLEVQLQKLLNRTIAVKISAVESSLIPFLRTYASHPSNATLEAETVDRRCNVLQKWWTFLLDLIHDWANRELTNRDYSSLLEATILIMERPEWTYSWHHSERLKSDGDQPFAHDEEMALANRIFREVQNIFIHNLHRQIAFVVRRYSSRDSTGLSTNFGGTCCAYAFFFCPGVAEMLIRLWNLPAKSIRKVADQAAAFEVNQDHAELSESIVAAFPPALHSLRFTTIRSAVSRFQKRTATGPDINPISWVETLWLERWNGKKSDLIFHFLRRYHILLSGFLPEKLSKHAILHAPGHLYVLSKMMSILRLAFYCDDEQTTSRTPGLPPAALEALLDSETAPVSVHQPPDAARSMIGRRFLALTKDLLGDATDLPATPLVASAMYAQSVDAALKTATRMISLYDHDACYNLCDFLDDILPVLLRFRARTQLADSARDAAFWGDVFKLMLGSNNTLTIMRLFTLIYSLWPTMAKDPVWRSTIGHDLILDKDSFSFHFNHWCPLVRVYFMRLLAWRVARVDGSEDTSDPLLPTTLLSRLQESWSHYKYDLEDALGKDSLLPSTAPCNPIPARRLLIIRTDSPLMSMHSSNNPTPPSHSPQKERPTATSDKEESYFSPSQLFAKLSVTLDGFEQGKKRNGIFRALGGYRGSEGRTSSLRNSPSSQTANDTEPDLDVDTVTTGLPIDTSRSSMYLQRPNLQSPTSSSPHKPALNSTASVNGTSPLSTLYPPRLLPANFKFSLEVVDRRPNPDIALFPPRLPLAAHLLVESQPGYVSDVPAVQARGPAAETSRYTGRALAEWSLSVNECQNFFERRKKEGVRSNREVETPSLGVESLRRLM